MTRRLLLLPALFLLAGGLFALYVAQTRTPQPAEPPADAQPLYKASSEDALPPAAVVPSPRGLSKRKAAAAVAAALILFFAGAALSSRSRVRTDAPSRPGTI